MVSTKEKSVVLGWSVLFAPLLPLSTCSSTHLPPFSSIFVPHIPMLSLPTWFSLTSRLSSLSPIPLISLHLHLSQISPRPLVFFHQAISLLLTLFSPLEIAITASPLSHSFFSAPSLSPFLSLCLSVSPDNCVQALVKVPPPRTN